MNNTINANKYLNLYISILFIFSVFYLQGKYNVGNDSTVSEWLINYEGGFIKRGLIGQLTIYISKLFDLSLRSSILFFQIACSDCSEFIGDCKTSENLLFFSQN